MMVSAIQRRFAVQHEIADALLDLAQGSGLTKQQRKSHFVLERKAGKSESNKNAVSFLREGVSFMVGNLDLAESKAKSLGLQTERSKRFPRIVFPNLTLTDIQSNLDFFEQLTREAGVQAEYLQSASAGRP